MSEEFIRTRMLLGNEAKERLEKARVAVFGIGGVGGYTVEALARAGIGQLDLIDSDTVSISNLNRQLLATHSTVGMLKVEAAKARVLDINPRAVVRTYPVFYTPETADDFDFTRYDYIVDAIDTVTAKIALVEYAKEHEIPIISYMDPKGSKDGAFSAWVKTLVTTSLVGVVTGTPTALLNIDVFL